MEKSAPKNSTNNSNAYARYSAMAFQMLAAMLLFTYIGYRLDQITNTYPLLLILGLLLGVGIAMYIIIKSIPKK
ncbi:MAG: AtpZ/AtpI family protein [Chitinophagales bacterium]|mgnify:CR=1 FL=1|jgi:F0F1-type ATP synthase assembly protein I|nr:AtpZ/AtpI family protein [Chitinophagales bacterium]HNI43144.1 AtpZ/AtpI family protein [Chitinophagales bacterium]